MTYCSSKKVPHESNKMPFQLRTSKICNQSPNNITPVNMLFGLVSTPRPKSTTASIMPKTSRISPKSCVTANNSFECFPEEFTMSTERNSLPKKIANKAVAQFTNTSTKIKILNNFDTCIEDFFHTNKIFLNNLKLFLKTVQF